MTDSHWRTLRVATYNIHRSRGLDGRTNPERIAEVIRAIDADVVALQEVIGAGPNSKGHAEEIGALVGMGWVMASTRHLRGCLFGNVVLSRLPIRHHSQYDLSWKTCEPRCAQRVDIAFGEDRLHLYVWGRATYDDMFEGSKPHFFEFCQRLQVTGEAPGNIDLSFTQFGLSNGSDEDSRLPAEAS